MLKSVVVEAKEITSSSNQKRDLEIFQERAAAAQIAPNPTKDGVASSKQIKQFIKENLE